MQSRFFLALVALSASISSAAAERITVANFGGANAGAQKLAYYDPFEKDTGIKISAIESTGNDIRTKIKSMVLSSSVTWDVAEMQSQDLKQGCKEGTFEKLEWTRIASKADFQSAAISECGVGMYVWSVILAYNGEKFTEDRPVNWADFWDVKRFPGKRGMRKGAHWNLEIALMADGVKPPAVYQMLRTNEGIERAFKKLAELKPHIVWWESGGQPIDFLSHGDVALSTVFNGRLTAAQRSGKYLLAAWYGNIYDLNYWAIPKGAPNKDASYKFIRFASAPENQAKYSTEIAYGPTNDKALAALHPKILVNLPTAPKNAKDAVQHDVSFWADRGDELEKRFGSWLGQ